MNNPGLMFCDWSYDYYFNHFLNREPDRLEKQEIMNQERLQKTADGMIVLFPDVADYLVSKYHFQNIYYIGNVVNSEPVDYNTIDVRTKFNGNNVVFIGSKKYREGLVELLKAIALDKKSFISKVYVIGMVEADIPVELRGDKVEFLGYLDKTKPNQYECYYHAVNNSKIFINTTPEWAAFSATLDCMYRGTPVITSKYRSFENTFGKELNFGSYSSNNPKEIADHISSIMELDEQEYFRLSLNARRAVEPFSWSNYTNKILQIVDNL